MGVQPTCLKKNHITYLKVVSSNTSHLEAHAGFFRLLMKGIFYPYVRKKHRVTKSLHLLERAMS